MTKIVLATLFACPAMANPPTSGGATIYKDNLPTRVIQQGHEPSRQPPPKPPHPTDGRSADVVSCYPGKLKSLGPPSDHSYAAENVKRWLENAEKLNSQSEDLELKKSFPRFRAEREADIAELKRQAFELSKRQKEQQAVDACQRDSDNRKMDEIQTIVSHGDCRKIRATLGQSPPQPAPRCLSDYYSRRPFLEDLARAIVQAQANGSTHAGGNRGAQFSKLFGGSFDWHSTVAGYWARLGIAEYLGDAQELNALSVTLSTPALDQELKNIEAVGYDVHAGEMPYGVNWLLLLVSDLSRIRAQINEGRVDRELEDLRGRLADKVLRWLKDNTIQFPAKPADAKPEDPPPQITCITWHTDWALAYVFVNLADRTKAFSDYQRRTLNSLYPHYQMMAQRCARHTRANYFDIVDQDAVFNILTPLRPSADAASNPFDPSFTMDLNYGEMKCQLFIRKNRTLNMSEKASELFNLGMPGTMTFFDTTSALLGQKSAFGGPKNAETHYTGAAISRMWPLAIDRTKAANSSCSVFDQFLGHMQQTPEFWRGHFQGQHYLPQYIFMGIWLEQLRIRQEREAERLRQEAARRLEMERRAREAVATAPVNAGPAPTSGFTPAQGQGSTRPSQSPAPNTQDWQKNRAGSD